MESVFNKLGTYDFFGIFLTGLISICMWLYLSLPIPLLSQTTDTITQLVILLADSYIIGLCLRECSSILERRVFPYHKKALKAYLDNGSKTITNEKELDRFRKMACGILDLKYTSDRTFEPKEQEFVLRHCRTYLEIKAQDAKEKNHNSWGAMSRGLSLGSLLLLLYYTAYHIILYLCTCQPIDVIEACTACIALLFLTCLFYYRASWLHRHRVVEILRRYYMLTLEDGGQQSESLPRQ